MASSPSGGVKVMNIGGRMARERERCIGMSDLERAWRAKYMKSQILAPEEPLMTESYYKEYYNPLRRFYRKPLDKVESALTRMMSPTIASVVRNIIGRSVIGIIGLYCGWYYFKYNTATWMRKSGWNIIKSHETLVPGCKNYPNVEIKKPNEYATRDFEKSRI